MTEAEARSWLRTQFGVSRETLCADLVTFVLAENDRQNLISPSTIPDIWSRHVIDSAQLLDHVPDTEQLWLDIGTGAGFPGLVVAILRDAPMLLVEPRRRRAEFLAAAVEALNLSSRVTVSMTKVEQLQDIRAAVISARAVARLDTLFAAAIHCAGPETQWVLPKGQSAADEVAEARVSWHGVFQMIPSRTNADARIILAERVRAR